MKDYLTGLNPEQKSAVLHKDGPLLIIAGAGAGKTKTITHRILHLIKEGVAPKNILAITFTNKAAKEMQERVTRLLEEDNELQMQLSYQDRPTICTFHSLGVRILRENSDKLKVNKNFSILDSGDTTSLIKEALNECSLDPKKYAPRTIKSVISKEKNNLVTCEQYNEKVGNEYFPRIVADVWVAYEKLLRKNGGFDFDDLIMQTVILLKRDSQLRKKYQDMWKYIHIDEYQDTNTAQYELSKLLTGDQKNICVVGDMDQCVYGWRGADFRNIMNFEKDYPGTKVVLLEENYRSTANILGAANDIIKKNEIRVEKNLFTRKEEGEKIGLYAGYDELDEANFIAKKSAELIESGVAPRDIAVLYRANFQSRVLEEAFLHEGVPYQVLGVKFFERKEVKDILSFLRAALNPESLADIKRVINMPPRGIGKVTLTKIFAGQENELPAKMREKVASFRKLLERIDAYSAEKKISDTLKFILTESGIEAHLKKGTEEDKERLENIYELVTLATKYDFLPPEEAVQKLLEDAALASDQDSLVFTKNKEPENAVRLMTVHASKGLEFPNVFIAGLEQDLFPHAGFDGPARNKERDEEERRLFYVALTRAEQKAIITYASVRTIFGSRQVNVPSEFVTDISAEFIEELEAGEPIKSLLW